MISLLASELLKVRGRWLPWILSLVLAALLALTIFAPYLSWRGSGTQSLEEFERQSFVLPWSLAAILDTVQGVGAILLAIVAASFVGTEYGWGTVRSCLIRGQTRPRYLAAKLLGLAVVGLIFLAVAFALGLIFTVVTTRLAERPITLDVPAGPSPAEVPLMFLRTVYAVLPYVLLAFFLAEAFRSTAAAVGGSLIYTFVESILLAVLGGIGGRAADMRLLFIGHHVNAVLQLNHIGVGPIQAGFVLRPRPEATDLLDPAQAALALALYCLFFVGASLWLFQRRDVRS